MEKEKDRHALLNGCHVAMARFTDERNKLFLLSFNDETLKNLTTLFDIFTKKLEDKKWKN